MYQPSLIAEDTVASYEHLVSNCLSEDFNFEHISQDFFCFLSVKGTVLRAQSLQVKEPWALDAQNHSGLEALSPSFLCYVASY